MINLVGVILSLLGSILRRLGVEENLIRDVFSKTFGRGLKSGYVYEVF